jgi:hypothetical protein
MIDKWYRYRKKIYFYKEKTIINNAVQSFNDKRYEVSQSYCEGTMEIKWGSCLELDTRIERCYAVGQRMVRFYTCGMKNVVENTLWDGELGRFNTRMMTAVENTLWDGE